MYHPQTIDHSDAIENSDTNESQSRNEDSHKIDVQKRMKLTRKSVRNMQHGATLEDKWGECYYICIICNL